MGREYWGNICGKFWCCQDSDDATFFGVLPTKIYNKACGCKENESCTCVVEHDHTKECDSSCAKQFDENEVDKEHYQVIQYKFDKSHSEFIKDRLQKCIQKIRSKLCEEKMTFDLTNVTNFKTEEELKKFMESFGAYIEHSNCEELFDYSAKLELGIKIFLCLSSKDSCMFYCEV
jgi:hypothetical protein